jgi:chorismate synthase
VKYDRHDLRDVLERASARETAARVAAGALARQLLSKLGIEVLSHVVRVGPAALPAGLTVTPSLVRAIPADAPLRCVDPVVEAAMVAAIDAARAAGDTLGGAFEVMATGVVPGLGSYAQWDRKLDGRLAQALMSIPAIKAVGIGAGTYVAEVPGSHAHDEIVPADADNPSQHGLGLRRPPNRAGGLEGGVTNGEDVRVTAFMKPISTLMQPLRSVDLVTMAPADAAIERSDVCAVPAAAVVGEAMVCLVLADALLERFSGDSFGALEAAMAHSRARLAARFGRPRPNGRA